MNNERTTKKSLSIRMKIFNTQIFIAVYDNHYKDNAKMNFEYLDKNFNILFRKGQYNDSISGKELGEFHNKYDENLQKLYSKKME